MRTRPSATAFWAGALVQTLDTLCAEGRWMYSRQFEPTPAWDHALTTPQCGCHWLKTLRAPGGQVLGYCRLFPATVQGWYELGIGVLAPYRGRGIGTRLLTQTLCHAHTQGWAVYLHTHQDNAIAQHLFVRQGFYQPSTLPAALPPPHLNEILMVHPTIRKRVYP